MIHQPQHRMTSLSRRRLLQGTLSGVAGLAAWHQGWPRLRTAAAQKRTVLLYQIQQRLYDEVRFIPIWDLGGLHASGPRVARYRAWA